MTVGREDIHDHRRQHHHAQRGDQQADHISYGAHVVHGPRLGGAQRGCQAPRLRSDALNQERLAGVVKRIEKLRIKAFGGESLTLAHDCNGIVRMQAFLMAGNNSEVPDPRIILKLLAE